MPDSIRKFLMGALHGRPDYVDPVIALEALSTEHARQRPHPDLATIWEQLAHIVFWQDHSLQLLRGEDPANPKSASESWPPPPAPDQADKEWSRLLARFHSGLKAAEEIARTEELDTRLKAKDTRTVIEGIFAIAQHNAYHFGQIVTLRRLLRLWPPPSGGDT